MLKKKVEELQSSLEDIKKLYEQQNKAIEDEKTKGEKQVEEEYRNKYQM